MIFFRAVKNNFCWKNKKAFGNKNNILQLHYENNIFLACKGGT